MTEPHQDGEVNPGINDTQGQEPAHYTVDEIKAGLKSLGERLRKTDQDAGIMLDWAVAWLCDLEKKVEPVMLELLKHADKLAALETLLRRNGMHL